MWSVALWPVSACFATFDAAADRAAEIESAASSRGDVLHLFVS